MLEIWTDPDLRQAVVNQITAKREMYIKKLLTETNTNLMLHNQGAIAGLDNLLFSFNRIHNEYKRLTNMEVNE